MGGMVELRGGGAGYLAAPGMGAGPALIVIQEWWGLDDHIEDVCERYAAEGFTALAPDLDPGTGTGGPSPARRRTAAPDEAGRRVMGLNLEQAAKELGGAIDFLGASESVRGQGVGVTGFGMGGALALVLAAQRPGDVRACVPFYGVVPDGAPAPDWSKLEAPVQGHFAEGDGSFPPEQVRALEEVLHGLGKDVQFAFYPADHGFFDDRRGGAHDPESARTAWIRSLDFFRSKLG